MTPELPIGPPKGPEWPVPRRFLVIGERQAPKARAALEEANARIKFKNPFAPGCTCGRTSHTIIDEN